MGVNKRFNRIAYDRTFTSHLSLMKRSSYKSMYDPLSDPILDRFCSKILPEIHHQINWLDLESTSMNRILRATNYPNLYGVGLYGIDIEGVVSLFIDEAPLSHIFNSQISSLVIAFIRKSGRSSTINLHTLVFTQIFTIFTNLRHLHFDRYSMGFERLSFDVSPPTVSSSTLLELHVCVRSFSDCLYLLDGRFNQLRSLHVNIYFISPSNVTIHNKDKLPNLRFFPLDCDMDTRAYDKLIVPLLHRMLNLEKLDLLLILNCDKELVNGNELKKNIINHMPRLNNFTFNIYSYHYLPIQIDLSSNEDTQHTFEYFYNNKINSCVDYFKEKQYSQCLIYSYSYKFMFYKYLSNNFTGGFFKYVTEVSLYDERPFEHEFFLRIAHSFPIVRDLTLINRKPQLDKQYIKSKNNNQNLSIIEWSHLTRLTLCEAHDDYVEQFLVDTKTCLPNIFYLSVDYQSLERVTHNFRRNATRVNCAKLRFLSVYRTFEISEHVKDYFPHANVF
ncbi:unnamed protein product [Rotaria sp. Silwood2]|nr:unnamed protein product [Rotaria sp. Silwood2]CAF4092100.1 unnamed protein product [Rotaria sp. Silwood2]